MSTSSPSAEELTSELTSKLSLGSSLLASLSQPSFQSISGVNKLEKKIRQELKFLDKFQKGNASDLKREHLQCSNLLSLSAVVGALLAAEEPAEVLRPFPLEDKSPLGGNAIKKVTVDIVCQKGLSWIKVIARNPKALDLNSSGGNQFGQKSFMNQVNDYIECAKQNPKRFRVPRVIFDFRSGVSQKLSRKLEKKGVTVRGEVVQMGEEGSDSETDSHSETDSDLGDEEDSDHENDIDEGDVEIDLSKLDLDSSTLNLDITAMIAYVSALTNGHSHYAFKEPILTNQADWERLRPVKPVLDTLFQDKDLICCDSAVADFKSILATLGGKGERQRAEELLLRVRVVPDAVSPRLTSLYSCRKIKPRSLAIFGTADKMKVMTVSANSGFVRAARGQGVDLGVILHESRALTEDKMKSGKEILLEEENTKKEICS